MDDLGPRLAAYADVALRVGLNLQSDQPLVIRAPLEAAAFVRVVAAKAYAVTSRDVQVEWEDEPLSLIRYQLASEAALAEYPLWKAQGMRDLAEAGAGFLTIAATDPDLLRGVDPQRVATAHRARMAALADWYQCITGMRTPWTIVSVPTAGWAAKVFPELPEPRRTARLWECIFASVRIGVPDPVAAWRSHLAELGARAAYMNRARFRRLHYRGPGTQLRVDLPDGHCWVTSPCCDPRGIRFVPNMPTEEIFTLPARTGVEGVVSATMPLNYHGALIEGLQLRFAAGRVVAAEARVGRETLQRLIATDEGAQRLGEVALVPHGSAVSSLGTLFYNTLFDENAASHLALGRAYPTCLEGGQALSAEQLEQRGANVSLEHVDFMIGSADLAVDGETAAGATAPVMRDGQWAFTC